MHATPSPVYIAFDGEPLQVEQIFLQKVVAFVKHVFKMFVYGFVGW